MVKSILDTRIEYNETKVIDPDDEDYDANLYTTELYGQDIIFALGKPKYTYLDNNLVFYPIYLVEEEKFKMQIGLYEIWANTQDDILDSENDIDLNKFDKPLLYAFTYKEIHKQSLSEKKQKKELAPVPVSAPGYASASASAPIKGKNWVQNFMQDPNYDIIDTKYDGNCFFNVIRLALEENDQDISVDEMREVLAQNVTEELFENYKAIYESLKANEISLTREIKNITARFNNLQTKMKTTKDRQLQLSFSEQSDKMKETHAKLKEDRKETKNAINEFAFMDGIISPEMLKLKMKTNDYWADTWAISTLEREMNIKIIIFSELNFTEGDEINTLQCGQLNDRELEERGKFEPSFYLLAAYHGGYHYKMITYNQMKSFNFEDLPKKVIELIKEKCLEKMQGPYSLIPEFNRALLASAVADMAAATAADDDEVILIDAPLEELSSDLYEPVTVFRFYSKSADKPLPGKGEGETLGPEGAAAYNELAHIPQWRKKLSHSWAAEFKLDGHKWQSVEHYYQASKFKKNNRAFYLQFSLDAKDSSIARDTELAKAAGGKSGKFKGELVRPKDVAVDADFFTKINGSKFSRGEIELENALKAKFTQHADLKALLLATKKAKLEQITRGKPAIVFNDLMRVRRELHQM